MDAFWDEPDWNPFPRFHLFRSEKWRKEGSSLVRDFGRIRVYRWSIDLAAANGLMAFDGFGTGVRFKRSPFRHEVGFFAGYRHVEVLVNRRRLRK